MTGGSETFSLRHGNHSGLLDQSRKLRTKMNNCAPSVSASPRLTTAWHERNGRFKRINSKQRIGLIKKVSRAPGQALSDFNIFKLVAHYWGCEKMFEKCSSPESVFQILKELSRDQPCDITGIRDYQMIDSAGGIQCPLPDTSNDAAASKDEPAPGLTISLSLPSIRTHGSLPTRHALFP